TGHDIEEYAARYVFAPIGITSWYWKRSPTGLADTEGGLYLKPADLARIWYLFLQNGKWQGKQIVTPEWVKLSTTPAIDARGAKYGLKWWLVPYGADNAQLAWAGSGFGGQLPIAFPDKDVIAVFNAWNILPRGPGLGRGVVVSRVLESIIGN